MRCVVIRRVASHLSGSRLRPHRIGKEYLGYQGAEAKLDRRVRFVFVYPDPPLQTVFQNRRVSESSPRQTRACLFRGKRYQSRRLYGRENYDTELCNRSDAETGRPASLPESQAEDVGAAKSKTGCATGSKDRR